MSLPEGVRVPCNFYSCLYPGKELTHGQEVIEIVIDFQHLILYMHGTCAHQWKSLFMHRAPLN